MKVKELIEELQKMPQDKDVVIFDGPSYCTPSRVYVADWGGKHIYGRVIVD